MKIILLNGIKLRFENIDYQDQNFIEKLFGRVQCRTKKLIKILVDDPDDFITKIALRLKNGEMLEIKSFCKINKLNLHVIVEYINSKYKKYLYTSHINYNNNDNNEIYIIEFGYKFIPNVKAWYDDNKFLNITSLKAMVSNYLSELNKVRDDFYNMISFKDYTSPDYYGPDSLYNIFEMNNNTTINIDYDQTCKICYKNPLEYEQILLDEKTIKITKQCSDYIRTKFFFEINNNSPIPEDDIKDIIYNDINNIIPRYNFNDVIQSIPQSFSYADVHINDTISQLCDNVTITFTDRI